MAGQEALFECFMIEMTLMLEKEPDTAYEKLDAIAFRVGQTLFECHTQRGPRLKEHLEIIKFICKQFWDQCFKKHIDNLRTNHKGVYVLQDNAFPMFKFLGRSPEEIAKCRLLLGFPCGLIRGALAAMGITVAVTGSFTDDKGQLTLPACKFTLDVDMGSAKKA